MMNDNKSSAMPINRIVFLFALEGAIFTMASLFSTSTTNLFLTRVGASDYEISLYSSLTQFVSMLLLIPAAIMTDRLKNKRAMVQGVLIFMMVCFLIAAGAPLAGTYTVTVLVLAGALSMGSVTLVTSVWQAYFADVVPEDRINDAYAVRNRWTFIVRVILGLLVGAILTAIATNEGKIRMHQFYYILAAACVIAEIIVLRRIRGGDVTYQTGKSFADLKEAVVELMKNKRFLAFAFVAVLFYLGWKMDGAIFYLSQVKYVGLSEFWLNASNAACSFAQIVSISFWAWLNAKKGVRFGIIFGAIGLIISPFCIILPLFFEGPMRIFVHILFRYIFDTGFTVVNLNFLQCLLQVIGEKNRTLSIAVYTTFISLVSVFMPIVGVNIYTNLGADQAAMVQTMLIMAAVRVIPAVALFIRYWVMRNEPK